MSTCTVIIAAPGLQAGVRQRALEIEGDVLAFPDTDALRALDVITERQPSVVVLERLFAATPRGAALINRVKADPTLGGAEIRVVAHDSDYIRVSPRRDGPVAAPAAAPTPSAAAVAVAATSATPPAAPLDQRGTRRAPRYKVAGELSVSIDGTLVALVDVSVVGAQVVSPTILKPNQRVRVVLPDDTTTIRFGGVVAWASFEIPPKSSPRYRAGVEFLDADPKAVEAFCLRHRLA